MNALNEVLLGSAAVLSPIWISCLIGAFCWAVKHTVLWIQWEIRRYRMEERR